MNVLVLNSGTINNQTHVDPSVVANGEIAAFNAVTGAVLKIAHATVESVSVMPDRFYFVRGGTPLLSTEILEKAKIKRVVKRTYVAPVKKVVTVSSITTGVVGAFGVRVHEVGPDGPGFRYNKSYEVMATAGNTAADIVNNVIAMIQADKAALVVPTLSGSNLVLTSVAFGNTFEVSVYGDGITATVATTTPPVQGSGSPVQVRELERRAAFDRGFHTVQDGLMGEWQTAPGPFAQDGNTYNLYTIQHETRHYDDGAIGGAGFRFNETVLAISVGATAANIDTFFGSLLVTA